MQDCPYFKHTSQCLHCDKSKFTFSLFFQQLCSVDNSKLSCIQSKKSKTLHVLLTTMYKASLSGPAFHAFPYCPWGSCRWYKNNWHQLKQHAQTLYDVYFTFSNAFKELEVAAGNNQLLRKLCNKFICDVKLCSPSYRTQNEFSYNCNNISNKLVCDMKSSYKTRFAIISAQTFTTNFPHALREANHAHANT